MKKFGKEFLFRGLIAAAGGPIILAIIYGILGASGTVQTLSPTVACKEILGITVMAFIAAGITGIYTVERLPLISAILIHAGVLYLDYLIMYLCNNWIPRNPTALWTFTAVFAAGFALVWLIIYISIKSKTRRLNTRLEKS